MLEEDADGGTCFPPGALDDAGVRALGQRSLRGLIHRRRRARLDETAKITGAWVGSNAQVSPVAMTTKAWPQWHPTITITIALEGVLLDGVQT